ncbi:MAG TPA: DUF6544 family protein [Candidatus Limnocylindrales bacterium]|nr:DUF6544 family protein [Candidatus Limnocylindrales bacterium]
MAGRSFDERWAEAVHDELGAGSTAPARVLTEADLAGMPAPVRRHVVASGAVGRPVPRSMRVVFDAVMRRKPGESGMQATSTQVNVFGRPVRLFLMKARMFGLPVRALHLYRGDEATFQVRAAGLVTMVDESGDAISRAETVTVLNDLCVFAPGAIAAAPLVWAAIDDRRAAVTYTNGRWSVRATLLFNERDELVDFWSDDRPENADGARSERRWSTPISDYRVIDGLRLPTRGLAVYERPEGPFTYGEFTLRSIEYDVAAT